MTKNCAEVSAQTDLRRSMGLSPREALVEAALRLFGERGFDGTSTRAIAQMAGCNIGLIAFHFSNKAGLYREVRNRLKQQLQASIQPVTARLTAMDTHGIADAAVRRSIAQEMQNILLGLLEHAGDQAYFLLLRRSLRAGDEEARELYEEVFLPLFRALEAALNASCPGRGRENGLRAFLVIDAAIAILRDYPSLYEATGHAIYPREDTLLLTDILCGVLWNGQDNAASPEKKR